MTLVLSDQEIASRDCENGVLGAFWMSYLSEYGSQDLGMWQVDVQEFPNGWIKKKSPCNENQAAKGRKLE